MSQHPYTIPNQLAPAARTDINNALKALASCSSGPTAPSVPYANQLWYDTSTDTLKIRSEANNAWFSLGLVNQTTGKFEPNQTTASVSEAIAGSTNNPVTPPSLVGAFLPLLQFFQPAGSNNIKLSNGLILQWGSGVVEGPSGASVRVDLIPNFPSGFIAAHVTVHGAASQMLGVSGWDTTGFTVNKGNADPATRGFFWLALGY